MVSISSTVNLPGNNPSWRSGTLVKDVSSRGFGNTLSCVSMSMRSGGGAGVSVHPMKLK